MSADRLTGRLWRRLPRPIRLARYAARRLWRRTVRPWIPRIPGSDPYGTVPARPIIPQAVVFDDAGRVLLVKRRNPRAWEIPGGYMHPAEPPRATIVREVREETGLVVQIEGLLCWYHRTGFRPHLSPVYVCRPVQGTLCHSCEAIAVCFFPPSHLPLSLFPWYRAVIVDALAARARSASPFASVQMSADDSAPHRTQRLGLAAVAASLAIHFSTRVGLLP